MGLGFIAWFSMTWIPLVSFNSRISIGGLQVLRVNYWVLTTVLLGVHLWVFFVWFSICYFPFWVSIGWVLMLDFIGGFI